MPETTKDIAFMRIRLPRDLKRWLAVTAAENDVSMQTLLSVAVRQFCENFTPEALPAKKQPRR